MSSDEGTSKRTVYAALIGNILVAITKVVAAVWTGSSAMASEAVHSFVDTGNEVLLLHGMRQSRRRPDPGHPLGYGRELYFWSFIVALLVFALGAGVNIYQGIRHVITPASIENPGVNYIVLALAFLFEGASWWVSARQFNEARGELGIYQAFRRSKDPPLFVVFFEDSAALAGICIAALGTFAATSLGAPRFDGIASILIGLILAGIAALLARESKSLLIGERADPRLADEILAVAAAQPGVERAFGVLSVQLAPDQIAVAISLKFDDNLRATEIEQKIYDLETRVRATRPEVVALFVKPQSEKAFREIRRRRYGEVEEGDPS
jgi:cation diffusion facilitator family transporter